VTAVIVNIPKVIRPFNSDAAVMRTIPVISDNGDITRWITPRSFGFEIT